MGSFLTVNNVIKTYRAGETAVNAVNGMTFSAEQGEFVVIVGPSGAGKTTVLNLLGGMDAVTSGEIVVDGTKVSDMNSKQLTLYRRNDVGFVFQFYNLMPTLPARENVELATELCKNALSPDKALELVGLSARAGNFPAQLSGGEQQRVSIARAVAKNPKILLCDEPTGALDYNTGKMVLKLLFDMCRENKKTVIVVTHNSALKDIADRVIYIKNGVAERVEQNDSPKKPEEIEW